MKKFDKLNLASEIYRQKTPTKSPTNLKQVQSAQANSFIKTYHNVCCPNCRYLFKIPKQYVERSKTPINNTKNQNKQLKNRKNIQVQTQQYLLGNFRTSPKKQKVWKNFDQERPLNTDRTPDRLPRFFQQSNNKQKSPSFTEREQTPNQQLMTSRKKVASNKTNQKISNLKKSITPPKPQFPTRQAYFQQTSHQIQPNTQKIPHIKTPKQTQRKVIPKAQQHQQNLTQINNNIANQLIKKIHLTQQINQIIKYNVNLPTELSIPSYCKMLIYDMKQNQQKDKLKFQSIKQTNIVQNQRQMQTKNINGKQTKRVLNY